MSNSGSLSHVTHTVSNSDGSHYSASRIRQRRHASSRGSDRHTDVNHDRWLISYADFITLLFAFFVVMYSISQVNESKYRVISETLNKIFDQQQPKVIDPFQVGDPQLHTDPGVIPDGGPEAYKQPKEGDGFFEKTAEFPQLTQVLEEEFAELMANDLVHINSNEYWLEVELKSSILFSSADATPSDQAKQVFADIAEILKPFNNPVQVEGFTDNVPINNSRYPSNWELSSARAAAVVKLLNDNGVEPERLSAVGYGEFQPLESNATEAGRAANRRVALMIAREKLPRPKAKDSDDIKSVVEDPDASAESDLETNSGVGPNTQENTEQGDNLNRTNTESNAPRTAEQRLDPVGDIKPVELDNGGLLFSSDPDLPRNN